MGLLDQHMMFLSAADHSRTKDIYGVSYMIFVFLLSPLLKEIFQMIIKGEQIFAKKLMDTVNGHGCVPLLEAVWLLSMDLVWLRQMEYFVKAFFAWGEQEGTELTCDIILIAH